jgi:hypothetical protein
MGTKLTTEQVVAASNKEIELSEFEDFIKVLLANEGPASRQRSLEFHETLGRKDKALNACRAAIVEAFDNVRFGHYFKIHDHPASETPGGNFDLSMAGKDVMLFFKGKVFESKESPNGFAATVTLKAARRHSVATTGSVHDVQCDFKQDGECVPEELFETVTAAVRELFETP